MEAAGLAFGVATTIKLVVECYQKCRSVSAEFNNLHDDLVTLEGNLVLVARHVTEVDLRAIREVVQDIMELLLKPRSLMQRFTSDPVEDIDKLRTRLIANVVMLNNRMLSKVISILMTRNDPMNTHQTSSNRLSISPMGDDAQLILNEINDELHRHNLPQSAIDGITTLLMQRLKSNSCRSTSSTSSLSPTSAPTEPVTPQSSYPLYHRTYHIYDTRDTSPELRYSGHYTPSISSSIPSSSEPITPLSSNTSYSGTSDAGDICFSELRYSMSNSEASVNSSETGRQSRASKLKSMSMFKFPHTDFIMAAKAGDVLLLEKLSQDKNNKKDTTLDKALISVSKRDRKKGDQVRVINYLLELGASVECADRKYRCTPLIWTIVAGRDDLVDCLLDNNANIDAYDQYRWWTPLMWAIWYDHQIIVDLLIKRGASLVAVESECYWTPLLLAARYGRYQAARTLLEKEHSLIRVKDRYGLTPLALAYHYGHGECIPLFLEYGDNPNFEFASRQSLLHFAIAAGNITLVKLLLEKGADVECTNSGLPALIAAVKHDNYEITDLLAKHIQKTGGSFEGRDKTKDGLRCTALLWAVRRKNEDLVFLLVARKADLYATDQHGRTVQNWAEWTRNRKIIQIVTWDDGQALSVG